MVQSEWTAITIHSDSPHTSLWGLIVCMEEIVVRDGRVKEKFMVDDAYLNGYAKICGIYATGVYMELCRRADRDQKCWPSIARIAVDLGISVTSVKQGIKCLKKWNIIATSLTRKRGGGFLNVYTLIDKKHWSPHAHWSPNSQSTGRNTTKKVHTVKETHNTRTSSKTSAGHKKMYRSEPDEIETRVDMEGNQLTPSPAKTGESMKALLRWAEARRGRKFTRPLVQYAAMKRMRVAGIVPKDIKARWEEMENDPFWQGKGFDFATVAGSFDRKT